MQRLLSTEQLSIKRNHLVPRNHDGNAALHGEKLSKHKKVEPLKFLDQEIAGIRSTEKNDLIADRSR